MSRNWVEEPPVFSALLVAPASERGALTLRLPELADGLRERGHRVRLVTSSAIFHALSAEPTHIIHTASLRATYAAALASFAFTLRHPCAPEPAIVTTLDEEEGDAKVRRLLPGDSYIFPSERARDAFGRHLGDRAHVIVPGRDSVAAILAIYRLAWERRQRENRQALLAFEA